MRCFFYTFIFLTLCLKAFPQKQNSKTLDSLFKELKKEHNDTTLAKVNYSIGAALLAKDQPDSAFLYLRTALWLSEENNFDYVLIKANTKIGYCFYDLGELDSCMFYYTRAIKHVKEDTPDNYDLYAGLGTVYFYKGDLVKSYEYYLKALKVAERSGKQKLICKAYGNVGVALKEQMKLDDALIFFNKAKELSQKDNYPGMAYVSLTNIGNVYSEKFEKTKARYDAEKALDNYLEAKKIVMTMLDNEKDRSNAITLLGNIGNAYADLGDYNKARDVFSEAVEMMGDKIFYGSRSMIYNNFATVYIELHNLGEAEKYLKLARKEAEESGSPSEFMDNFKNFALLYEAKGDFKNAYYAHWRYKKLSDSLFNTENAEKRKEIELNAEFAQKEAEAKALQDKKEALAKEEENKQKILLYAFIIGFVLMIIVAFQFYRSYRIKQKSNEIITLQKQEVEKQKELVEMKQKEILDSIQYAERIQKAHLPTEEYLEKSLNRFKKG